MPTPTAADSSADARIAALEAALSAERDRVAALLRERDVLRASHERLRQELELLKRRIFVAKAERVDSAQLELEFAEKLAELDRLGGADPSEDSPTPTKTKAPPDRAT